jgi:SNF2 family DNA or RNA helicase
VLNQLLLSFTSKGLKTLVFSSKTQVLDIVQKLVKAQGWAFCRLDGSTSAERRTQQVRQFQSSDPVPIFLLSTGAGGLGITLTAATRVVIFDFSWNPSSDNQAIDRSYRIGQTEEVEVYRLVAKGTIEEMKYLRQVYKDQVSACLRCRSAAACFIALLPSNPFLVTTQRRRSAACSF